MLVGIYRISTDGIPAVTLREVPGWIVRQLSRRLTNTHSFHIQLLKPSKKGGGRGGGLHRFFRPQN